MLRTISVKIFGRMIDPYLGYFETLHLQLKRSGMTISLREYLSIIIFLSTTVFIFTMLFCSFFITIWLPDPKYTLTLSVIISPVLAGLTFFIGYIFPSIVAANIKSKIDKSLPFAAFYMATSASSGINPVEIFRILGMRGGIIGHEAQKIYTNIKTLGMDINTAIQKAATRSPSVKWSDLLWGMSTVISSGGDLELYLRTKTESLMASHRRMLSEYSNTISLYTEIYMTLIIVGTLFFIVLLSIMAPLVGAPLLTIQTFVVFLLIPLVSIGFIVLLKSISPFE